MSNEAENLPELEHHELKITAILLADITGGEKEQIFADLKGMGFTNFLASVETLQYPESVKVKLNIVATITGMHRKSVSFRQVGLTK